jgi:hypothetical protein
MKLRKKSIPQRQATDMHPVFGIFIGTGID